jgi:hypothetical protein
MSAEKINKEQFEALCSAVSDTLKCDAFYLLAVNKEGRLSVYEVSHSNTSVPAYTTLLRIRDVVTQP